jgi:L-glyceraldehyde 3-phosphate reductase
MMALDLIVRQGKALYAGISNYPPDLAQKAFDVLRELGTPCIIHQPKYSMFERTPEAGLLDTLEKNNIGCIAFSPLAQGLLSDKYLKGIPDQSRAARNPSLSPDQITPEMVLKITKLNDFAAKRGQKLAEMAISWLLKDARVTSVLIGASKVDHIHDAYRAHQRTDFSATELVEIEAVLAS